MLISFCAAEVASAPLHFPSSITNCIFLLADVLLNVSTACVIAATQSSPNVLAGHERGAINPILIVVVLFSVIALAVFCCPHPARISVDNHTTQSNTFFMTFLLTLIKRLDYTTSSK